MILKLNFNNKNNIFSDRELLKSISKIAIPSIIEMSLNTLVGIVDTLMISNMLGTESLVAVGFANQLIFTIIFIFSSFNVGATSIVSRAHGENDVGKLNVAAIHTLALNIIIGIIISILSVVFANQMMGIYDIDVISKRLAISYFDIVSYSSVFMFITFSISAILRGIEDTKTPMYVMILSNIVNIVLNYILIKGVFIFPALGINGAAIATSISRLVSGVLLILILIRGKNEIKIMRKYFKFNKDILSSLWKISYPGAVEQFFMRGCMLVSGVMVSQLDIINEAAFRVILNIESISFMPAMGLSIATSALVGKSLGEHDSDKGLKTGYITITLGIIWGILTGIIFFFFGKVLTIMFTRDLAVITVTYEALCIAAISQVFLNILIITSGALRGAGDTKSVMLYTILRLWLIKVPLVYLFIVVMKLNVIGVWYAELIAYTIFSAVLFRRFRSKKWTKIKI